MNHYFFRNDPKLKSGAVLTTIRTIYGSSFLSKVFISNPQKMGENINQRFQLETLLRKHLKLVKILKNTYKESFYKYYPKILDKTLQTSMHKKVLICPVCGAI